MVGETSDTLFYFIVFFIFFLILLFFKYFFCIFCRVNRADVSDLLQLMVTRLKNEQEPVRQAAIIAFSEIPISLFKEELIPYHPLSQHKIPSLPKKYKSMCSLYFVSYLFALLALKIY